MSVRLSRKHSDALSATAAAEDSPTPPRGRKAAASPAGSRKKKVAAVGSSARTPSPAGPPSKAASSASAAAAAQATSAPRDKARRNAQPDSSPAPLGRPLRHLNAPGEDDDLGPQATDDEDLRLSGESDTESVGSRAVRAPVRSRSRSNAKGYGSNVWHEAASSSNARAKPAAPSVSWDPDASASPVGTWADNLSYPAVGGVNEGGGPARKGSDARRAATAERERIGAQTRKQLFEQQKAKDAAAAAEAKGQRGCFAKLVSFVLWMVLIGVAAGGAAFLAFQYSLPTDISSSIGGSGGLSNRDAISAVSSQLAARFPPLRSQIERVLDPALRHHADSFVGLDNGAGADEERSWLEGSLAAFAHPKPLVIVLATDGTSRERGMDARSFMAALHSALEANAAAAQSSEPLALLELGQADATLQQLRDKLSAHFASGSSHQASAASDLLAGWTDSLRSAVHSVAPGLGGGSASSSSSSSRLASSLSRGLVFVSGAGRFPRSAAEAFHQWVDDVSAPQPRSAFVFEVDVSAARQGAAAKMRADEAVQRTLERQWEQGKVPRDEVIRPLLGRIVRNVVDLTTTAAP